MNPGYVLYVAAVLAIFAFWFIGFVVMRRHRDKAWGDFKGFLFAGPLHFYLKRRRYELSQREVIGWGAVLLLMIAAPIMTKMLG